MKLKLGERPPPEIKPLQKVAPAAAPRETCNGGELEAAPAPRLL
eukprot:CAMPEP_0172685378 /NCGR_PEP_ID=MMETSP1074-20121228/20194_1 /TAXON_ID=2916 /ORGANISM="Ceratium fusus, Strain PA161109" /LENGTH=43 /DNA_ID= /DNA_START= /DNA_END= /DNA_ORIENTATION=